MQQQELKMFDLREQVGRDAAHVLIVDDEPINNLVLQETLNPLGFTTTVAENGRAALEAVDAQRPNLILLDVMMPVMDGFETCTRLKASKEAKPIPVLFLTALTDLESRVRAFEVGAADVLSKPFQEAELLARVSAHLRLYFQQQDLTHYADGLQEMVEQRTRMLIHSDRLVTLGTMSAKIIHEIQNPLTTVMGQLQLGKLALDSMRRIHAEPTPASKEAVLERIADVEESLGEAAEAAGRITSIADGLRRYARKGGQSHKGTAAPLAEIISRAIEIVRPRVRVAVSFDIDVQEGLMLRCDVQAMQQAFANLIVNSSDAIEPDHGTVSIKAWSENNLAVVDYRDDGPGIPEAIGERVFEPFFTTKDESRGTGLGMMIVSEIFRSHGGNIRLRQDVAKGAAFRITIAGLVGAVGKGPRPEPNKTSVR
ncbi:Transcriptional activator protein CzcR [Planctomycetes bacterium Pan216]|uniref:histidine kinase n=1 Tax=Kolteria novifilia TaxID=2527975 RepID=A0A518B205_9BACT|nr:Transcriptional activator protein CzcR [Planctomycetes bacterium Pan216]